MIRTIAAKELRSLLVSPTAWALVTVVQAICAYFFIIYLEYFLQVQGKLGAVPNAPGVTDLVVRPLFVTSAIVFLLVIPLLSMRLISEEQRSKTLILLLSAPVSMSEIILGKFFGLLAFIYAMVALVALMPLSLLLGGSLDMGLYLSGLFGLLLVVTSFTALGLYVSTLTRHPTVAAVASFGLLLFLWIMEFSIKSEETSEFFQYLSMLHHYVPLMQGAFNSSDAIYYLLFTATFVVLSIKRLDTLRLSS